MGPVTSGALLCLALLSVATNAALLPASSYLLPSGQEGSEVLVGASEAVLVGASEGSYEDNSGSGRDDLDGLQNVEQPQHTLDLCSAYVHTSTMTDVLTNTMTFYQTTWITTTVPSTVHYQTEHYVTQTHTKTITDSYHVTELSTLYSSMIVTETHSQTVPAQTFYQTHTTTVTEAEWTSSTMDLTMTYTIKSTVFETMTTTTSMVASSTVPYYETSYSTLKPETSTIVNVHTSLATLYTEVVPFTDLQTSTIVSTSTYTSDVVVSPQTLTSFITSRVPEYHYRTTTVYHPTTTTQYHDNIILSTDVAVTTETVMYTQRTTRTNLLFTTVTSSKDIIAESATVYTSVLTSTSVMTYLETVSTTSTMTQVVTQTVSSVKTHVDSVTYIYTSFVTVLSTPPPVIHTVTQATEVCTNGATYTYYK